MTQPPWEPQFALTLARAEQLLRAQFPPLAGRPLRWLGRGWDNDAVLVDDTWVFRFPRRQVAVALLENEARLLPRLAARLPVPVPCPVHFGRPSDDFPYPFLGYRLLPGVTADRVLVHREVTSPLAAPMARFLRALHDAPPLPADPGDALQRSDSLTRLPVLEERLSRLVSSLPSGSSLDELLAMARHNATAPPHSGPPVLVHGDLYSRHLLLGDDDTLAGVIDWGDVHRGDPALDLSLVFGLLPAEARPAFFQAYGTIDDETEGRARFRALFHAAALLDYGLATSDQPLVNSARRSLVLVCR